MGEPASKASKRIAVVTGANKGIGLEICRQLSSSSHGVLVILTARDEGRGTEAVEMLKASGASDVWFHQLDVADPSSVALLADFIRTQFGRLDILVNNAAVGGMMLDDPSNLDSIEGEDSYMRFRRLVDASAVSCGMEEECLNINYYGMKRVTEALIPFLRLSKSPRIVNVSSHYGLLRYIPSESIRKAMRDVDELHGEGGVEQMLQSYLNGLKEGKLDADVWPTRPTAYKLSKAAVNAYTRILAKRYPEACINCVAPGFVKTDMNFNMGTSSAEEGAQGPVMLALLPVGSPSGVLYDRTNVFSFE